MNFEIKTEGDILKVQKQEFQLLGKFPFIFSTPNYALEHVQLSLLI